MVRRQLLESSLLLRRCRDIDPLIKGPSEFVLDLSIKFPRVLPQFRRYLAGKKIHQDSVLIRCPDCAIPSEKGGSRTLFSCKAERAINQSVHEPLEAYRDLRQSPPERGGHALDHGCGDEGFPNGRIRSPPRSVLKQIVYSHGQIMIWVQKPHALRDDAMTIGIRIVS